MSFSRLSVLAVFLMMIMSAFVAFPTYNVGADEHEGDDDGPFLNAFPTGGGGDPEDYEMSVHSGEGGANITVEATELIDGVSYRIEWDISFLDGNSIAWGGWNFTPPPGHVTYYIGPDILNDQDFDPGCYIFTGWLFEGPQIVLIEMESWLFTLDYPIDGCDSENDCPFDPDVEGSPCEDVDTNPCWGEGNHDSEECHDYVGEYCATHDDPGCYWDDGGDGPSEAHIDANMVDLATWEVYVTAYMDPMWSDDMRAEIANRCAEMSGESSYETINTDCVNNWIANFSINEHHDVHYGDHGGDGCPPEMSEDLCAEFKEVCDDEDMNLSCFGFMVSYCNDDNDDPMCQEFNSHDDDDGFFMFLKALFDYEDDNIGPEDYLAIVDSLFDFEGPEDYGQSALYDAQTLTITTDEEGFYSLHPNFGSYSDGSHSFVCGNGDEIPFYFVNDDNGDCPDGADEQWYDSGTPNETSDDCQMWNDDECEGNFVNWYDCHDGSEIWVVAVNNGEDDCPEGEDEYHEADYGWYGHVFLYTGHFNEVPDSTENLVGAASEVCDYVDDDEVYVFCELAWDGYMEAGNYTVVTAGGCYTEYNEDDEEELHCNDYGDYNHSLTNVTGDLVGWVEGTVEEDDSLMTMTEEHYNARDDSRSNFPLYDTYELTVGDDGFNGSIISAHYNCSDHDGDGEYDEGCNNGYDMSIYLYEHSFDPAEAVYNLMASNDEIDGEGLDCPADEELFEEGEGCSYSGLQVDLTSGDYVVVTTSRGFSNDKGFYKNDLVREDGEIIETWDGELIAPYWDCCNEDDEPFIVDGDDRTHMPWPWMYDDSDDGGDEGDDPFFEWAMQIIANLTAYEDGDSTAVDAADNIVDLVYWAAETGLLFEERGDGPSFVCGNGEEIPFDWVNDGEDDCGDGSDEQQYDEDDKEINWFNCHDGSEVWIHQVNDGVEDCADGEDEGYYHDDGGEGEEGCPFDSPGFCHEIRPYCDNNDPYYDAWYCGSESAHYCMEDGASDVGCEEVVQSCESGDPDPNNEICDAFLNFDHDAYHGYGDDGTDDDRPVTLDGVDGVEDPADWDDMLTPSSENVLGILSDNEGLPIMLHSTFTITFDETYPDNDNHVFVIPSNADPDEEEYDDDGFDWQITFRVTEDYQINSCTGCDDISVSMIHDDGRAISFTMNDDATHDIAITFSSAEDYCPFYSEAGMALCVEQEEEGAPCSEDAERSEANGAACAHVVIDFCAANEDEGCAEFMDETVEFSAVAWCNSEEFEDEADDWDRGFCDVFTAEPEPPEPPQPDCDVTVGVDATGEAFDTPSVKIEFGQTVCWKWEGTEMAHNVVQVAESGNTTMLSDGFYSGDPSDTMDYRVTFDEAGGYSDDTSYYYICEPHATAGMVGEVVVGTGSTDEELEAAIEDSGFLGLPNISFIIGVLVLIGAASLRRRIH